jgi:trk system potassium uptake protein TrkA
MGEVGRHLAAKLSQAGNDVVAIDISHSALAEVESSLDVLTLRGDASVPSTLERAEVGRADLVVAVSNDDQANLVTCTAARERGARTTAARLNNRDYFSDRTGWQEGLMGVDLALCPGLLSGAEVVRLTRATNVDYVANFAGELVQVMVIAVDEKVPAAGKVASQLNLPTHCRLLAVIRDGATQTPESIPHLQPEDRVIVAGPAQTLYEVDSLFRDEGRRRGRALVVGGGAIGSNVARELLKIMDSVVLMDRDAERCAELAESLHGVQVARGEGTSIPFLEEADARHCRAFVATTDSDEVNLMASLLAKQLGAEQAIALLHRGDYAEVFTALGIDSTVSPRLLVADEIIRFIQRKESLLQSRIPIDGSLVVEIQIAPGGHLEGKRLFDLDLPHGVMAAAVTRGRRMLDEPELVTLEPGDVLVALSPERSISGARRALTGR